MTIVYDAYFLRGTWDDQLVWPLKSSFKGVRRLSSWIPLKIRDTRDDHRVWPLFLRDIDGELVWLLKSSFKGVRTWLSCIPLKIRDTQDDHRVWPLFFKGHIGWPIGMTLKIKILLHVVYNIFQCLLQTNMLLEIWCSANGLLAKHC